MNINVYIEDSLGKQLNYCAKHSGQTRNTLIREAIREWLENHQQKKWPNSIMLHKGYENIQEFETYRNELLLPKEDLFE